MGKPYSSLASVVFTTVFASLSFGQITIGSGGGETPIGSAYTQDFNTLAITGTSNTWVNNSTIAGWYSDRTVYIADSGTSSTGGLHSHGTTSTTERCLGSIGSGSATPKYGVRIKNNSGKTITGFTISYTGEQWRNGGNTTAHKLDFQYQISSSSFSDITSGTYTDFNSLDFTGPIATASASALDGNAVANKVSFTGVTLSVIIENGSEIMLRWSDVNDAGNDHGLGIDDFSLTANAVGDGSSSTLGAGTGAASGNGVAFTNAGGTLGAMFPATLGNETMSLTVLGPTVISGSAVAAVFEIDGCTAPPYTVVLNVPAASLVGVSPIAVAHNNNFITPISVFTNLSGDAQITFTATSCSPFFVQDGDDGALFVNLTSFTAKPLEKSVKLSWTTESEVDNLGFVLMRSENNEDFNQVASYLDSKMLAGQGSKPLPTDYTWVDEDVSSGITYFYYLIDVDYFGTRTEHKDKLVSVKIDDGREQVTTKNNYLLGQNYPNPFNPNTTVSYELKRETEVKITVYNTKGELVRILVSEKMQAGIHEVVWNGTDETGASVASGVYFYKMEAGNFSETKKMVLLK